MTQWRLQLALSSPSNTSLQTLKCLCFHQDCYEGGAAGTPSAVSQYYDTQRSVIIKGLDNQAQVSKYVCLACLGINRP